MNDAPHNYLPQISGLLFFPFFSLLISTPDIDFSVSGNRRFKSAPYKPFVEAY